MKSLFHIFMAEKEPIIGVSNVTADAETDQEVLPAAEIGDIRVETAAAAQEALVESENTETISIPEAKAYWDTVEGAIFNAPLSFYGFHETEDMWKLREKIVAATRAGEDFRTLGKTYQALAEAQIDQLEDDARTQAQIGLLVAKSMIWKHAGNEQNAKEELQDAIEIARHQTHVRFSVIEHYLQQLLEMRVFLAGDTTEEVPHISSLREFREMLGFYETAEMAEARDAFLTGRTHENRWEMHKSHYCRYIELSQKENVPTSPEEKEKIEIALRIMLIALLTNLGEEVRTKEDISLANDVFLNAISAARRSGISGLEEQIDQFFFPQS